MVFAKTNDLFKVTGLLLPLILMGCGGSPSDDDSAAPVQTLIITELDPSLPPEGSVQGVWSTTCFFNDAETINSYQKNTYKRRGAETFYIQRFYDTAGCAEGFTRELLLIGETEDVGTVEEPIFGVSATSVLVTVSAAFVNAALTDTVPEPFYDLVYRSGESIRLGLPGTEDSVTKIPQQLNWVLGHHYVDI